MDEPKKFAGRVIHKGGRQTRNDYPEPQRFFEEMAHFLSVLDGVPLSAVEELESYESNRDVMVDIVRRVLFIFRKANVDIQAEIKRMDEDDRFDGLEDEIAERKRRRDTKDSGNSSEGN